MASVVASTSKAFGSSDPVTLTAPTGTVDGSVLFAVIVLLGAATVDSVPAGWTQIRVTNRVNTRLYTYRKTAGAGEPASWNWGLTSAVTNAGFVLRLDTVSGSVSNDNGDFVTTADTPSFPITITPTVAGSLILFPVLSESNGGTLNNHNGYAIATDNPTWTEAIDIGSGADRLSVAWAERLATSATGNASVTVGTGGTANSIAQIVAYTPRVDATVTPDPVLLTLSMPSVSPTGNATITPSPVSLALTIPAVTPATPAPVWMNPDKSTAPSWTNPDKS